MRRFGFFFFAFFSAPQWRYSSWWNDPWKNATRSWSLLAVCTLLWSPDHSPNCVFTSVSELDYFSGSAVWWNFLRNMFCDLLDLNEMDVFFFLNVFNANDFNGNTVFVHSWPTESRCSVKNPTLVDASLAALKITHMDSGVVRCQVISALSAPCSRWQFSGVEIFKCVLTEREVSLMLALQMCWCVLWDQWNDLGIFNQMSWQIYSPPLRGWLTLWRSTLEPPRSR